MHIWTITGITYFISSQRYCFLQTEGLQQPFIGQVYCNIFWTAFVHLLSLCHILAILIIAQTSLLSLCYAQWSLLTLEILWLAQSWQFLVTKFSFSNKVFLCGCLFKAYISHLEFWTWLFSKIFFMSVTELLHLKPQFLTQKCYSFLWEWMWPTGTWRIMHFSQGWASTNKSILVGRDMHLECTLIFKIYMNTLSTLSFNTKGKEKTYTWALKNLIFSRNQNK